MSQPPQKDRRHSRQQLVLKVEFDDVAGFRSNFLSDLSEGGVRLNTSMDVGQRLLLNISFLGFVEPLQIEAIVQWSIPATDPEGPAAGLAFVNPTPEATSWLFDVLQANTQSFTGEHDILEGLDDSTNLFKPAKAPERTSRVLLLEAQPFLREIYGQEVRNWAELRDEQPLQLVALEDPAAWYREVVRAPATLGIIDADELPIPAFELYHRVRASKMAIELPLIVLGSPISIAPFSDVSDDLLFCLRKPLRFGVLMNTVRVLARDE